MLTYACMDYLLFRNAPGARRWLEQAAFCDDSANDFVRLAFERAVINGQSAARDSLDQLATLCALAWTCPSGEHYDEDERLRLLVRLSDLLGMKLTEAIREQVSDPKWSQDLALFGRFRVRRSASSPWTAYAAQAQGWYDDQRDDLHGVFQRHVMSASGDTFGDADALIADLLKVWKYGHERENPVPAMMRAAPA